MFSRYGCLVSAGLAAFLCAGAAGAAEKVDLGARLTGHVKGTEAIFTAAARDALGHDEAQAAAAWKARESWYAVRAVFAGAIEARDFKLEKALSAEPAKVYTDYDDRCAVAAGEAPLPVASAYEVSLADVVMLAKATVLKVAHKSQLGTRLHLEHDVEGAASWRFADRVDKPTAGLRAPRGRRTLVAEYELAPGEWHETTVHVDAVAAKAIPVTGHYALTGNVAVTMVPKACLYTAADFAGRPACFDKDTALRRSLSDKVKSIKLPAGGRAFIYRDGKRSRTGPRKYLAASDANLSDDREGLEKGRNWGGVVSAVRPLGGEETYRIDAAEPGPWDDVRRIEVAGKADIALAFAPRLETRSGKCGDAAHQAIMQAAQAKAAKADEATKRRRFEIHPEKKGPVQVVRR